MQLALHVPPVQEHILTLLRSIASSQVSLSVTGGTSSSSVPYRSSMAVIAVPRTFSWLMRSMSVTTRTTSGSFCNSLAEARSLQGVWLRVFLTSRSEIPIRYGFNQIQDAERQDFVLHSISPSIIDHDISIFLEYNLSLIGQDDAQEPGWPGLEAIRPQLRLQVACLFGPQLPAGSFAKGYPLRKDYTCFLRVVTPPLRQKNTSTGSISLFSETLSSQATLTKRDKGYMAC
jgi:hypothetical protein